MSKEEMTKNYQDAHANEIYQNGYALNNAFESGYESRDAEVNKLRKSVERNISIL